MDEKISSLQKNILAGKNWHFYQNGRNILTEASWQAEMVLYAEETPVDLKQSINKHLFHVLIRRLGHHWKHTKKDTMTHSHASHINHIDTNQIQIGKYV